MSLFSNAGENRRVKRSGSKRASNLLEVSARPEKEGIKDLRRKVSLALKVGLGVASVGVLVVFGKTGVRRLFWENPAYAIADLRVSTDGMLTRAQVLEWLGLEEGQNIFSVNVEKLKVALDALPQVERAEVRRMLPDRVEIRIVERQPIAWVAATAQAELGVDGKAYLVDARGFALKTRKVLPEHLSLPLIVGVNLEDVAPGQKLPSAELLAAVELLRLSADEVRWMPRVVDVSKGYCLLVTDQRKARVTFGFENLEEQLNRLRQLLETVEPMQRDLQTVNLMLERNIPVTFAAPPVSPTPDPKSKGKSVPAASGNSTASTSSGKAGGGTAINPLVVTAEQIAKAQAAAMAAAAAAAVAPPPSAPSKSERTGGVLVTVSPSVPKPSKDQLGVMREASREVVPKETPRENLGARESEVTALKEGAPELGKEVKGGKEVKETKEPREGVALAKLEVAFAPGGASGSKAEVAGGGSGAAENSVKKPTGLKVSGGEVPSVKPRESSVPLAPRRNSGVVPVVSEAPARGTEVPVRAIPVKRSVVPAGSSTGSGAGGAAPAKPEVPKSEPTKTESQPSKPAPLIPNERLRKMFQPHA